MRATIIIILMQPVQHPASRGHFAKIDEVADAGQALKYIESKSSIHYLILSVWSPLNDIGFKLILFFKIGKRQNVGKWLKQENDNDR